MTDTTQRLNLIQRAMQQSKLGMSEANTGLHSTEVLEPAPSPAVSVRGPASKEATEASAPKFGEVSLDYTRLRDAKIALPGERNSVTFNEFRSIKRKLLPLAGRVRNEHRSQNIVMVSSALPGEGKTFTSLNLAISLATEKNLSVILVDGDVVRSSVRQYFRGNSDKGLLDLFGNSAMGVDDVLHRCKEMPNLYVLFAGTHNDAAPEMFASPRMAEICDRLSKRYPNCIVIIDSPPVLATSEPRSLVTHIDHLVMVIAAGKASRPEVESAVSALSSCRSMFLLLNKAPKWQQPAQGSYYYYSSSP